MKDKLDAGFSLVEMALVMIISGLIYAAIFTAYVANRNLSRLEDSTQVMREIDSALTEFVLNQGRYPCPARREAARSDADYATENCDPSTALRIDSGRDMNEDGVNDFILIGALPYDTLAPELIESEMPKSNMLDVWGNKYTYAVTETLTDADTYNDEWGAIRVEDEYGKSVISPENSAHLVVLSHGPNGKGAFSAEGKRVQSCNLVTLPGPPPPGPPLLGELENCDEDDADFVNALRNDSDFYHYDDVIRYQLVVLSSYWEVKDIYDDTINLYENTNVGNVGVGVLQPTEKLDFSSGLKVSREARTEMLCSEGGTDCLDVNLIVEDETIGKNACPPTEGVRAISGSDNPTDANYGGAVDCEPIFDPSNPVVGACVPPQVMVGIRGDGSVICDTI